MRRDAVVDPSFEFPRLKLSPCGAVSVARIHKRSHRFLSIQSTCFMITTSMGLGPELPYLEAFRAVCVEGGFTAAARQLGCTQPAVSYQVRKLEKVLGVRLLERDGRRVVLTPAGRRFRAFADRVFEELARGPERVRGGHRAGAVAAGLCERVRQVRAAAGTAALRGGGRGPVEVRLEYDAADMVLDRLEAGEYEAAFVYKRRVSNALSYGPCTTRSSCWWGAPGGVRSAGGRAGPAGALEAMPFVTYEECEYVFGRWFERVSARSRAAEERVTLHGAGGGPGLRGARDRAVGGAEGFGGGCECARRRRGSLRRRR